MTRAQSRVGHRRDVGKRADAGVVDERVDAAEAARRFGDERLDRRAAAHVGDGARDARRIASGRERPHRVVEARAIEAGDHDPVAIREERLRDREPNSARATSHNCRTHQSTVP